MNNNYKELNIQKSLYRGCGESFAERLEKMDPTENYRGTELGHLDAFQRQLKRFDIRWAAATPARWRSSSRTDRAPCCSPNT